MQYSTLKGRLTTALIDSIDSNTIPLTGEVILTPSSPVLTEENGQPVTVLPTQTVISLGENGELPETQLIATNSFGASPQNWTWNVFFRLKTATGLSVQYKSFSFLAPAGEIVDLTTVTPVSQSHGVAITRGTDGVGVVSFAVTGTTMTMSLSNGSTQSVDLPVLNPDNVVVVDGEDGQDGIGITSVVSNGDSTITVNYSDGTFSAPITIPTVQGEPGPIGPASTVPGPKGDPGADSTVPGPAGPPGPAGTSTRITGVTATTIAAGTNAGVFEGGTETERTLQFMIPRGNTGSQGPAGTNATITGVTATGLAAGASPTVSMGGSSSARTFTFGIPAGQPGPKGDEGDSAYEVAVANGFSGTETQWLESLKGADGQDASGTAYDDTALTGRVSTLETKVNTDIPATYATKAELPAEYDDTALAGRVTTVENALPNKLDASTASTTYATQTALSDGLATKINSSTVSSNYLSKADAATTYATKAEEEARPRIYTGATAPVSPRAGDIWVQ